MEQRPLTSVAYIADVGIILLLSIVIHDALMISVDDALKQLPNTDMQVKRALHRRVFPCPKCGENVENCYAVRPAKKPIRMSGTVIPCPKCGTFNIDVCRKGDDYVMLVRETKEDYDPFSRMASLGAKISNLEDGKTSEFFLAQSDAYYEYAEELRIGDPENEDLPYCYLAAVSSLCKSIESGRSDLIEKLAHVTLRCNSYSKYDLMCVMRAAYEIIEKNRDLVPPALYIKVMIESALLENAFDSAGDIDGNHVPEENISEMEDLVQSFERLSDEEKAPFPYTAAEGLNYALSMRSRSGKGTKATARKIIKSIREARKSGAPEDREHMEMMLSAYRIILSSENSSWQTLLKDIRYWSDPRFEAVAYYLAADCRVSAVTGVLGTVNIGMMSPELNAETLGWVCRSIELMESMDDVKGIAMLLADAYCIRGELTGDSKDKRTAFYYAVFFDRTNLIGRGQKMHVLSHISSGETLGSPLQLKVMEEMGFPIDLLKSRRPHS